MRRIESAYRKWLQGCGDTPHANPWDCAACSKLFRDRMDFFLTSRERPWQDRHIASVERWRAQQESLRAVVDKGTFVLADALLAARAAEQAQAVLPDPPPKP